ncbi:MAG: glycosyltransferase family 2 protein [Aureispira sp.]
MEIALSVIIVSYKVPYFLEQTLLSALRAAERLPTQIIVVDNNSKDNTPELVREKFPQVELIANTVNTGFATANNQGIERATGEFVLFLNPDTAVQEDTFEKIVQFMRADPNIGGLGVHMIDGTGAFLPESKRGFPSPLVAFYKTFGLSKIFPRSPHFNQYHLGYLEERTNHQVDVLSGAFMAMPRKVLEEIGYWDEAFFMYGEDIDLSYRVVKAGYKNYYLADTTIIHYKGESTKKGSLNYVKTFYEAMIIFARKHFQGSKANIFVWMLQAAIYFRAFLTILSNASKRGFLLLGDLSLIYSGLFVIKNVWAQLRFQDLSYYDNNQTLLYFNLPIYVLLWVIGIYLRGGYDQNARTKHLITGTLLGTVAISILYAFFPQELRSSRMLILLGSLWTVVATYATRSLLSLVRHNTIFWSQSRKRQMALVGSVEESQRVLNLLYQAQIAFNYRGRISTTTAVSDNQEEVLGSLEQLPQLLELYAINEVIFCGTDVSYATIIQQMLVNKTALRYKIVPAHSDYIIGSDSKDSASDWYTVHMNYPIANSMQRRNKRLLDLLYSSLFLLAAPVLLFLLEQGSGLLPNIWAVLRGQKTWVGYVPEPALQELPPLALAVLNPADGLSEKISLPATKHRLNRFYAKDYESSSDWQIIRRAWRQLGRR